MAKAQHFKVYPPDRYYQEGRNSIERNTAWPTSLFAIRNASGDNTKLSMSVLLRVERSCIYYTCQHSKKLILVAAGASQAVGISGLGKFYFKKDYQNQLSTWKKAPSASLNR